MIEIAIYWEKLEGMGSSRQGGVVLGEERSHHNTGAEEKEASGR